jgi:deoxyribose-phosphate aldolase
MDPVLEIAKMIDHSLLHPTMTDEKIAAECELAKRYQVASVCVKPYSVPQAAELLKGSDVLVCSVIGFPHGNSTTEIKVAETALAIQQGATEIDMVANCGKMLGGDWEYVKQEIAAINQACVSNGAILKVIFENDFLPEDSYKIKLTEICRELGVAFIKTSTGYGFVKGADGKYSYAGATIPDLELMLAHKGPIMQVKAAGAIRTFEDALRVKEMGVTRIGASATDAIMRAAIKHYRGEEAEGQAEGTEGY